MKNYYFILDSNSLISIFNSGVEFKIFFDLIIKAFRKHDFQVEFWVGDSITQDIPKKFHDVKKKVENLVSQNILQIINVDRDTKNWGSIASKAKLGNGNQSFINPFKDPYDIDCIYIQDILVKRGKSVVITSDSGVESFIRSVKRDSLDLYGLCCTTRALIGKQLEAQEILYKLETVFSRNQERFIKSQNRMHVLAARRQNALTFLTNLVALINPQRRRTIPKQKYKTSRGSFVFRKINKTENCPEYRPIVASDTKDCFLCFNQRVPSICPNLEEFSRVNYNTNEVI